MKKSQFNDEQIINVVKLRDSRYCVWPETLVRPGLLVDNEGR